MNEPLSGALSASAVKNDLLVLGVGSASLSFCAYQLGLIQQERRALGERHDAVVTRLVWRDRTHLKHVAVRVLLGV